MEFWEFDDDLFAKEREEKGPPDVQYEPKALTPQWYLNVQRTSQDDAGNMQLYTHRGDHHFYRGEWRPAAEAYTRAMEYVASNNPTMRRLLQESLARCWLRCGEVGRAVRMGEKLLEESFSEDQMFGAHNLLATLHDAANNVHGQIESLQSCLDVRPVSAQHWIQLGKAYLKPVPAAEETCSNGVQAQGNDHLHVHDGKRKWRNSYENRSNHCHNHSDPHRERHLAEIDRCGIKVPESKDTQCARTDHHSSDRELHHVRCGHAQHPSFNNASHFVSEEVKDTNTETPLWRSAESKNAPREVRTRYSCPSHGHGAQTENDGESLASGDLHFKSLADVVGDRTIKEVSSNLELVQIEGGNLCRVCATLRPSNAAKRDISNATEPRRENTKLKQSNGLCQNAEPHAGSQSCLINAKDSHGSCSRLDQESPLLHVASCLVRAQLLLRAVQGNSVSIARKRTGELMNEVEQLLASLCLDPTILAELSAHNSRMMFGRGAGDRPDGTGRESKLGESHDEDIGARLGRFHKSRWESRFHPGVKPITS